MYYPDLSRYTYFIPNSDEYPEPFGDVCNIGWLDPSHAFVTGEVGHGFIQRLTALMSERSIVDVAVNSIRGCRPCDFCGQHEFEEIKNPKYLGIGSCEVWVPRLGEQGIYAAPSMILHYIIAHRYVPPAEYVKAVLALSDQLEFHGQEEYDRRYAKIMKRYREQSQ